MNESECKSCWWQEGGRCYADPCVRLPDGRSARMAIGKCPNYWNKRKALETAIPRDMLVITSERGVIANEGESRKQVKICVGRSQTTKDDLYVKDLDPETLTHAIASYMQNVHGGIAKCLHDATQILVWDMEGSNHNLIAVYDIRGGKITML